MTTVREIKAAIRQIESEARRHARSARWHAQQATIEKTRWMVKGGDRSEIERHEQALTDAKVYYQEAKFAIANLKLQLMKAMKGWYWT